MIEAKETFYFIDKREAVTKENERYLSMNVLSKDNRKFNFITKNIELINKISPLNLQRFSQIKLVLKFNKEFNQEKRTSYWVCELSGVE